MSRPASKPASGPAIRIHNAHQHNLKGFDLELPLGEWCVVTGVSGSGKSSLAFDTLYAEGQRRYVETFSPYARQFLDRMDRPQVDAIEGIPPAIAIDQTNPVRTSRSTVGTMTELNDHLKLLFARAGHIHCSGCGREVRRDMPDSIADALYKELEGERAMLTFPVTIPENFPVDEVKAELTRQGYTRYHSESTTRIEVVQDRLRLTQDKRDRLTEALDQALAKGHGHLTLYPLDANREPGAPHPFSADLHCPHCDIHYRELQPNLFSFNSAIGACEECKGFGRVIGVDWGLVIPDPSLSLREGAIKPFRSGYSVECQEDLIRYGRRAKVDLDTPWGELNAEDRAWVLDGEGPWDGKTWYGVREYFQFLESKAYKMHIRVMLSRYRRYDDCPSCGGARLRDAALDVRIGSHAQADAVLAPAQRFRHARIRMNDATFRALPGLNIHDLMRLPIDQCRHFIGGLEEAQDADFALLLDEIRARLDYLTQVGLGYLTLDRQSRTLSGGEVQRINLTTALGTSLVNTLFVLDEPSIGLHPRDIGRINAVLARLRDAGNTLLVVEHDPQIMLAAERILDIGPGPGERGGNVVFNGSPSALMQADTLTARYLSGELQVAEPGKHRAPDKTTEWLELRGAREHNLKGIDVRIPLGRLVTLTGVSGSGKSTLLQDVLYHALCQLKGHPEEQPGAHDAVLGHEAFDDLVLLDQAPIGKSSRSNPVSYVGAWDALRKRLAQAPLAKERGYTAATFSFNSGNGRCPTCQGSGFEHVEMQFLADVWLRCPDCNGKRYRGEVLEVELDGLNVHDLLELTVREALERFADARDVQRLLEPLSAVGLDYLRLGQPVPTLSGGEAQRLKLAGYLAKAGSKKKAGDKLLFLLDEPTTGLHFADIAVLLKALRRLIGAGHSLLLIEHNLDVIAATDWLIELGPEGGEAGGELVCVGTPTEVAAHPTSHTGQALREHASALARLRGDWPRRHGGHGEELGVREGIASYLEYDETAETSTTPSQDLRALRASVASPEDLCALRASVANPDIEIRHAREHNLKDLSLTIPREKLTVITGVSGSGKSTIAFDILFNEGQRRYLESLNAYARQFVQPAARAEVDAVLGIPPTVAIEQRTSRGGQKSTVGTLTEIHHYLRLLFVKLGTQYCPDCQVPIRPQSRDAIAAQLMKDHKGQRIALLAPLVTARKGLYRELAEWAARKGHPLLLVDGEATPTDNWPTLDRYREHTIDLPLGELKVSAKAEGELRELLDAALDQGKGTVRIAPLKGGDYGPAQAFSTQRACPSCGTGFSEPDPRLFSYNSKHGWCPSCFGTGKRLKGFDAEQSGEEGGWLEDGEAEACPACHGGRLNPEALAVQFRERNIADWSALPVGEAQGAFGALQLDTREAAIGADLLKEIRERLSFLDEVGLGYLTLDRSAPTLSGGEAQRIRLAAQLGSSLRGVCYILDEPTIGLHPRDNKRLLDTLKRLEGKGNTIVVVEHDEETIRRAEHVIDIGPGAGVNGGRLVHAGTVEALMQNPDSLTGYHLAHPMQHPLVPPRPEPEQWLEIKGAYLHNLKDIDVRIPLQRLVCVSGVSGSGKSTLVREVLGKSMAKLLARGNKPGRIPDDHYHGCQHIEGWQQIGRLLEVDQTPIGKTPRSCPATYVGIWDGIRKLFAQTEEARINGWNAARFSFNTGGGRCETCGGQGMTKVEMSFLPDVKTVCESCGGARFNPATLAATYRGRSIGDVLDMSIDEAVEFFENHTAIHHPLQLLQEVGLGYLTLGQQSPTLSGGEAQRLKLVTELAKAKPNARTFTPTLYLLDEPTVGLHMADVERLIRVVHRLVDAGHSVVVIEHNLDLLAEGDWGLEIGPEGGRSGGWLVMQTARGI